MYYDIIYCLAPAMIDITFHDTLGVLWDTAFCREPQYQDVIEVINLSNLRSKICVFVKSKGIVVRVMEVFEVTCQSKLK